MSDASLLSLSRKLTVVLAFVSLAIAMGVAMVNHKQGVFWFIIFGWSGIAATFCPVIILSLYWSRLTALGAKVAMIAGFLSVPIFKFAVPAISAEAKDIISALDVLAPAFVVSFAVAIVASLLDTKGQNQVRGVADELAEAGGRPPS